MILLYVLVQKVIVHTVNAPSTTMGGKQSIPHGLSQYRELKGKHGVVFRLTDQFIQTTLEGPNTIPEYANLLKKRWYGTRTTTISVQDFTGPCTHEVIETPTLQKAIQKIGKHLDHYRVMRSTRVHVPPFMERDGTTFVRIYALFPTKYPGVCILHYG